MIKSFKFKLNKVSGREQELLFALYSYLPATGVRSGVMRGIKGAISRHVGREISVRLEAVHQEKFSAYLSKLSETGTLAVIGMDPLKGKAVLDIDPLLAVMFVERLLGGEPGESLKIRELSETEQGVLQYLILQVLSSIYRTCGQNARVHFRFDRFSSGRRDLQDLSAADDGVAVLVFRIKVGRHGGFVRLAFPDPFVEEAFLNVESKDEDRPEELKCRMESIDRFSYVRVPLWAEAGRSTLLPSELSGIEEGDIILLDQTDLKISDQGPYGSITMRLGDGNAGGLEAELSRDGNVLHCTVRGVRKGE